jgi:hypothetical protein
VRDAGVVREVELGPGRAQVRVGELGRVEVAQRDGAVQALLHQQHRVLGLGDAQQGGCAHPRGVRGVGQQRGPFGGLPQRHERPTLDAAQAQGPPEPRQRADDLPVPVEHDDGVPVAVDRGHVVDAVVRDPGHRLGGADADQRVGGRLRLGGGRPVHPRRRHGSGGRAGRHARRLGPVHALEPHRLEARAPHAVHEGRAVGPLGLHTRHVPRGQARDAAQQQRDPGARKGGRPGDQRDADGDPQEVPRPRHGASSAPRSGHGEQPGDRDEVGRDGHGLPAADPGGERGDELVAAEGAERADDDRAQDEAAEGRRRGVQHLPSQPSDRELDQHGRRRDEREQHLQERHRHGEELAQQATDPADVLGDAGGGGVRVHREQQDDGHAEHRQHEHEQVAGVVHPDGRGVDDLHPVGR